MDEVRRGRSGKIAEVLDIIRRFPGEVQYEWRVRFGLPLSALADGRMTWEEGYNMMRVVMNDPNSPLRARYLDWEYPFSTEAKILADLHDLTKAAHSGKRRRSGKPYPRPYPDGSRGRSAPPKMSQERVRAELEKRGHKRR